jgi:putative FmdB family regulatory protein
MPTYEFWCQKCTKSFELFISIAEYERQRKAGVHCPDCRATLAWANVRDANLNEVNLEGVDMRGVELPAP